MKYNLKWQYYALGSFLVSLTLIGVMFITDSLPLGWRAVVESFFYIFLSVNLIWLLLSKVIR